MTTDSVEDDELIGTELNTRYRIERFIGAGTMGAVYEATQLAVGRKVAVKVLNAALKTHDEVRERFRLEAQAIASLNHPNCVTLFDFGYSDELGALYMVIEYLEGISLEEQMIEGLRPSESLAIAQQIADVVAQAHEAGILHRDLKPENVMLLEGADGTPVVKVLDFGLARIFQGAASGTRLTRQGQLFGSPAYMSPEQCGGALDVGPEADVYSLGVTMYEMLTGRLPFVSDNVAEVLVMHAKDPAPELEADVPAAIVELVGQMLAKTPATRPTARYAANLLKQHTGQSAAIPARSSLVESPRDPTEDSTPPSDRSAEDVVDTIPPGLTGRARKGGIAAVVVIAILLIAGVAALVNVDDERAALAATDTGAVTDREPAGATAAETPTETSTERDETAEDIEEPTTEFARAVAAELAVNAGEFAEKIERLKADEIDRLDADEHRASREAARDARKSKAETADDGEATPKGFRKLEFSY